MVAFEEIFRQGGAAAVKDSFGFFQNGAMLHSAFIQITCALNMCGIPYAIVDDAALTVYGAEGAREKLSILVTEKGLQDIWANSHEFDLDEHNVKTDFHVTGRFPGDGKPKPVAFPDPSDCTVNIDGIDYITLEKLVELKLASGMTGAGRLKDLADAQELIKARMLGEEFSEKLNPYVREKYLELWRDAANDTNPQGQMRAVARGRKTGAETGYDGAFA